jgi:hypothetical protein
MTIHQAAIRCSIVPLLVVALVAFARVSSADPITVRFTLYPDPIDPVNRAPVTSSFSFDSSLIPASAGFVEDRTGQLATDIGPFKWGNTVWSTQNASLWSLKFDSLHRLRAFALGGAPNGFDAIAPGVDDIALFVSFSSYTLGAFPERFFLARTLTPDVAIPEPGTLLLVAGGFAALAARRRTFRSSR